MSSPSKSKSSPKTPSKAAAVATLPCLVYIVIYHLVVAGGLVVWHYSAHRVVSPTQILLAVFQTINAWICVCEWALLFYPQRIQRESANFIATHGPHVLPPVFLFERAKLSELLTVRYWSIMWSTYASLDPAYVDTTTFGYCVDVGNGVTTLLPTILFAYGMTAQNSFLSAPALGMIGLVHFYQEWYGTVVYYFQFFNNKRHLKLSRNLVLGVVVPANAIWIVFPMLGMWASSRLILDGTFAVFS